MNKNQYGFSLVEVMLGAAFLALIALASAHLFKDQNNSLSKINDMAELNSTHSTLAQTLSLAQNCNATLKSILPTSAAITAQSLTSLSICDSSLGLCADDNSLTGGGGFTAYTLGAYVPKTFISVNDYINNKNRWRLSGINIVNARTTSGLVTLRMTYRRDRGLSDYSVTRDILLNVKMADGKFSKCVDSMEANLLNTQKDLCETFNPSGSTVTLDGQMAYWDTATGTCKISGIKDCSSAGYVVDGINSDGTMNCKKIVDATYSNGIQSSSSTTCSSTENPKLSYNTTTKKLEITCVEGSSSPEPEPEPEPSCPTGQVSITWCQKLVAQYMRDYCGTEWLERSANGYMCDAPNADECLKLADPPIPESYASSYKYCDPDKIKTECVEIGTESNYLLLSNVDTSPGSLLSQCQIGDECVSTCGCPAEGCSRTEVESW